MKVNFVLIQTFTNSCFSKYKAYFFIVLYSFLSLNSLANNKQDADQTLRINSHSVIETLDPAISYDWLNYEIISTVVCKLFSYAADANGNRVFINELADSYIVSEDKKTYTFKLKEDWYFSNGRNVVAQDFKRSLERNLLPERNSPGHAFFVAIDGYEEYAAGKEENIRGVKVIDKYQVSITLKQPKESFLAILTTNFAGVIDTYSEKDNDFDKKPISCGIMYVDKLINDRLVTKKNPYHPHNDETYWETVEYNLQQPLRKSIFQLSRNQIDLIFSKISTSDGLHALSVLKPDEQILVFNDFNTIFIALNNKIAPFDNVLVRKAINMAIDKERIRRHFLSQAGVVAKQIIPQGMQGYVEDYKGYEFDVNEAQALLKEAGYEYGFTTEMIALDDPKVTSITLAIKEDLARIGIRVNIRMMNIPEFLKAAADPAEAPMVFSEGIAWVVDYPHPSNFYYPLFSLKSEKGGWNWAQFYNEEIDRKVTEAELDLVGGSNEEIDQAWGEIYTEIMEYAPWVPLYHNSTFTLKSEDILFKSEMPLNIGSYILQPFGLDGIYRKVSSE